MTPSSQLEWAGLGAGSCVRKNERRGLRHRPVRYMRKEESSAGGGPWGPQVRKLRRLAALDRRCDGGRVPRGRRECDDPRGRGPLGPVVRTVSHGQPSAGSPALQFANRIKLVKVNVDDAPGLSRRFEVQSIPTLLLMEGSR